MIRAVRARARSAAGRAERGVPLRLLLLPLAVIRAQPGRAEAMRALLEVAADVVAGIDRGAIDCDGGVHAKHRLAGRHERSVERVRGERVLDVGCHRGESAYDLAERAGATVSGSIAARGRFDRHPPPPCTRGSRASRRTRSRSCPASR